MKGRKKMMTQKTLRALLPLFAAVCLLFAGCGDNQEATDPSMDLAASRPGLQETVGGAVPEPTLPPVTEPATTAPTETTAPVPDPGRLGCLTPHPASCVESWMEDRQVALSSEGGKGVGTYYAFVDSYGNVILEGTEEAIWATEEGYARVIFCEPGTTQPIDGYDLYDYFDSTEYGEGSDAVYDAYVERYDRTGAFIDRELLTGEGYWDRLNQGQSKYPLWAARSTARANMWTAIPSIPVTTPTTRP